MELSSRKPALRTAVNSFVDGLIFIVVITGQREAPQCGTSQLKRAQRGTFIHALFHSFISFICFAHMLIAEKQQKPTARKTFSR